MNSNLTTSVHFLLKVRKDHIGRLSGLLDGLDGIGYSRTIDPDKRLVEISAPISQRPVLEEFFKDLHNWITFKLLDIREEE